MKAVRISAGAGYAGDRIEPALENIRRGNVDFMIMVLHVMKKPSGIRKATLTAKMES